MPISACSASPTVDTLEVLHNRHPECIRLNGIDCPEKGQAFGKKAKQAASALAFGSEVTIQTHGHDKYQRLLGDVLLPDGTNVNHTLVKDGWCWWYRKYAPGDTVLEGLEKDAREARKVCGLIRIQSHRGSGGSGAVRTTGKSFCYTTAFVLWFECCLALQNGQGSALDPGTSFGLRTVACPDLKRGTTRLFSLPVA